MGQGIKLTTLIGQQSAVVSMLAQEGWWIVLQNT
jgi:hypothetical protein